MALPNGRKNLVLSKFIILLIIILSIMFIVAVANIVMTDVLGKTSDYEIIKAGIVGLSLGLISMSLLILFMFVFGPEKGRIFMFVFIFGLSFGVSYLTTIIDFQLPKFLYLFIERPIIFSLVLGTLAYAGSLLISLRVIKTRNF